MKKDVKKKWLTALRSGKYRQAVETLKTDGGAYCCLGVLCSVTDSKNWVGHNELPDRLMEKFELKPKEQRALIIMNDDQGKNFRQIADYIERHL